MPIEIEVKVHVPPHDEAPLRARLGEPERTEDHADIYYQHPSRDFQASDEALRLSARGSRVELTYKGPRLHPRPNAKPDSSRGSAARREIVLHLGEEGAARDLLEVLGFRPVAEVRKRRDLFHVDGFEVSLDTVPLLGVYLEVERVVPDDEDRAVHEEAAEALLKRWGLEGEKERRSYLELLLAAQAASP